MPTAHSTACVESVDVVQLAITHSVDAWWWADERWDRSTMWNRCESAAGRETCDLIGSTSYTLHSHNRCVYAHQEAVDCVQAALWNVITLARFVSQFSTDIRRQSMHVLCIHAALYLLHDLRRMCVAKQLKTRDKNPFRILLFWWLRSSPIHMAANGRRFCLGSALPDVTASVDYPLTYRCAVAFLSQSASNIFCETHAKNANNVRSMLATPHLC